MASLLLSEYAKKVFVLYRKDSFFRVDPITLEKSKSKPNIEFMFNSEITELIGEKRLEKIKINNEKQIELGGLFIETGASPNLKIIHSLDINTEKGFIKTDSNQKTNIPKVYAAGDAIVSNLKQIITACSQGAIAAHSAYEDLQKE